MNTKIFTKKKKKKRDDKHAKNNPNPNIKQNRK